MGRYSETLRRRLSGRALSVVRRDDEQLRFAYPIVVPPHPSKYPDHKQTNREDKGAVFGGECNTTSCSRTDAMMFNPGTHGYYCHVCADGINYRQRLCVPVDHDLSYEEQKVLYDEYMKQFQR